MPNFAFRQSVAAATTVANALAGSAFEFVGRPSRVAIALATSNAAGEVTATVQFGPEVQLEEGVVAAEPGTDMGPRLPDNVVVDDVAAAGDRLVVRLTNAHASTAYIVRGIVRILPIQ